MQKQQGQLLLEVLIALTILGLVVVAVVNVSTRSLKSVRVIGSRKSALSLAKQVMLEVEEERNRDPVVFFSGEDGVEDCGPLGDEGEYSCEINYVYDLPPVSSSVRINILISWEDGGNLADLSLDKIFTKIRL